MIDRDHAPLAVSSPLAPRSWRWYAILLLLGEKVVQHLFVTAALTTGLGGIRGAVAVSPDALAVAGGALALLFALALSAHILGRRRALPLAGTLALADIAGEFVAQGTIGIVITLSFLVALVLLVLVVVEARRRRAGPRGDRGDSLSPTPGPHL